MKTIGETIRGLTLLQKTAVFGFVLVLTVVGIGSVFESVNTRLELRQAERAKIAAERDVKAALEIAAKAAKEKVEAEKRLAELEVKRDGKVTEVEAARVDALAERTELNRIKRESRGDNPSPEQLCDELAALGYTCW